MGLQVPLQVSLADTLRSPGWGGYARGACRMIARLRKGWRRPEDADVTRIAPSSTSSLSERSLSTSFIVLREGKSASVSCVLVSKRPPRALSLDKTCSLRQTASLSATTVPRTPSHAALR